MQFSNRNSAWPLVAFGMIGTSLSGVTFISVPGAVGVSGFHYWQIMLGHLLGYALVAWVLLPLYYRLGLVSIYGWIEDRLGPSALRMAAGFFILSRTLGATARRSSSDADNCRVRCEWSFQSFQSVLT